MGHWCETCHGITTGGSPCAPDEPELPERTCSECGAECAWEDVNCPNPECDEKLYPTLEKYLRNQQEDAREAEAYWKYEQAMDRLMEAY